MKTSVKEHCIDVSITESELAALVRLATYEYQVTDRSGLKKMLVEVRDSLDLDTPKKIRKILEAL
mgnify:FL=1